MAVGVPLAPSPRRVAAPESTRLSPGPPGGFVRPRRVDSGTTSGEPADARVDRYIRPPGHPLRTGLTAAGARAEIKPVTAAAPQLNNARSGRVRPTWGSYEGGGI